MPPPTRLLLLDAHGHADDPALQLLGAAGYETLITTGVDAAITELVQGGIDVVLASFEVGGPHGIARLAGGLCGAQLVVRCTQSNGDDARVARTVSPLGLAHTLRREGRPKKAESAVKEKR